MKSIWDLPIFETIEKVFFWDRRVARINNDWYRAEVIVYNKLVNFINEELSSQKHEFPKAQRAWMFFLFRPLRKYGTPRQNLFDFLVEVGCDIKDKSEIGDTVELANEWFRKAEDRLNIGVAGRFELFEVMRKP